MDELIQLLKQIQDLTGVAIDAITEAGGGKDKKPEGRPDGPPEGRPEGGPPPKDEEGGKPPFPPRG